MSRSAEFSDGHDRARNHVATVGRLRKPLPPIRKHMQMDLDRASRHGGETTLGDPKKFFAGNTLGESMISFDEHQRRQRHRWLEENG